MELSSILTPESVAAAAGLVTVLIQVLKSAIPAIDNGKEKPIALVAGLALVALAVASGGVFTLPVFFTAFVSWLSIAKLSTGIYDEVTAQPGSFRGGDVDSP